MNRSHPFVGTESRASDLGADPVRIRGMRLGRRWFIAAAALAVAGSGCGGRGSTTPTSVTPTQAGVHPKPAHHAPRTARREAPTQVHIIDSFHARLINYHVVRVHWALARPAALELQVAGVRHGSSRNQTAGVLAIRPSDADTPRFASKVGTTKKNFEFGEFNFHGYGQVEFRLRARGPHRTIDASRPIVLSRPSRP